MRFFLAICVLCATAGSGFALTATNLAGFEGIEEPVVKYIVAQKKFVPDEYTNITDADDGTVRMTLRHHQDWWDGDRDRDDTSRQRAEVKGIGPHQLTGETFEYATTWRTSANFHGTEKFCHVFQLKAVDGDDGPPLVTLSVKAGTNDCDVRYWSGNTHGARVVRTFHWQPDAWQTVRIRITTSLKSGGAVLVSVNGDDFQGVTNVPVYRPEATAYRPKWGLYRGISKNIPDGESFVEHKNASAQKM